jgi:hypothetical protein
MRALDKDDVRRALVAIGGGNKERHLAGFMTWKRWKSSNWDVALVGMDGKVRCMPE